MKQFTILSLSIMMLISCGTNKDSTDEKGSIFYTEFDTEYGMPPFEKITNEDFRPAFEKGIEQQSNEIDSIANNTDAPTFENTIVALDNSGEILSRVSRVFSGVKGAENNDTLQAIAEEMSPLLSEHSDNIYLNDKLFERINTLHKDSANLELNTEQYRLLDMYYKNFVRSGIMLNDEQKDKLREINKELSALTLSFGNNLLKETNSYTLVIDKEDDLSGLPQGIISASAEVAKDKGLDGKWVFTLHKPSWLPFLQYADNRDLREKLYKAMYNRGNNDNDKDNKKNINDIVNLRIGKAQMLGYKNHADFVLEETMAKNADNVYKLLNDVWSYALPQAKKEAAELQAMIDAEGGNFKLESWDWWYYTEKVREQKYALSEEETKPYFKMENVRAGVFEAANRLWGLTFKELKDVPVYHPEVEAYEVLDADGSHLAVFYTDYFPRAGKNAGAWMSSFRMQQYTDGNRVNPIIYNVGNFSRATGGKPALLTLDEVETLFHEFGHALHGMLSDVNYVGLAGTSVSRDFVELPSQIMEHWAFHPDLLKLYAKHYETGEVIPDELINKINAASKFNMGFITTEFVAAALLDMDYHTQNEKKEFNIREFEKNSMDKIGLIGEIIPRYRSTYFSHIFSGGYSAGYYAYMWAEVLDADAFQPFAEKGIFNKEVGASFRENILSKGNSDDAMKLYKQYRGAEPNSIYLLKNRGFVD